MFELPDYTARDAKIRKLWDFKQSGIMGPGHKVLGSEVVRVALGSQAVWDHGHA